MMSSNGEKTIMVLYKVMNTDADSMDPSFNAFPMPRGSRGPTLKAVKQKCAALHGLNHLGPEGYHWRVCMEDKPVPGQPATTEKRISWWDVQDENAILPVKEATQYELSRLFSSGGSRDGGEGVSAQVDSAARAAKGAFKSLGKAMTGAVGGLDAVGGGDYGPPVAVIAFKLLDLVKMHDDFVTKNNGRGGQMPESADSGGHHHRRHSRAETHHQHHHHHHHRPAAAAAAAATPAPAHRTGPQQPARTPAPTQAQQQPQYHQQRTQPKQQPQHQATPAAPRQAAKPRQAPPPPAPGHEPSLMDFNSPPAPAGAKSAASLNASLNHMSSSSAAAAAFGSGGANETRAEKLKREYAKKNQNARRVWDDIDQRWVEVDRNAFAANASTVAGLEPAVSGKKKNVGIKLDRSNAVGKSATVQHAVNERVTEMRKSQAKALGELRERETKKKAQEAEEDMVRKKLEPKIKAWSEEHGKKKQLRALLASLHTILWPGANWKQVSIGDVLDDSKLKRCYHKASRVVHPDKTGHLNPEQRFLAKRIFDALSQAKTDFDNGAR